VFRLELQRGIIRHIAGTGAAGFTGHGGPALAATLSGPKGIALDASGNAWLADTESHSIRMIDGQAGTIHWIAGTGDKGDGPDGNARACRLNRPHGVFVDTDGSVYVGDSEAHRVRALRRQPR
jgi:streptogramin lyase